MQNKKTNRLIGLLLMAMFFSLSSYAQTSIKGILIGSDDQEPLMFASVSIYNAENNTYLSGTQTDFDGLFTFSGLQEGTYTIRTSYVGFDEFAIENIMADGVSDVDLGTISLKAKGEVLSEVVVQGTRPAMEMRIDRKIFNVGQSTIALGGTATDLLGNIPSLQVDMDGSVSLRGSSAVTILIDGKESSMAGNDITSLLQSLPANSIERVEIITNPSAKYDAEGQSGIINIVLKKDVKYGLNGSVNASVGSYGNTGGGVDLSFRSSRFTYSGSINYNNRKMFGGGWNETEFFNSGFRLRTESDNNRMRQRFGGGLGVDYRITDRTSIGVSGRMNMRTNSNGEDIFYAYLNNPEATDNSYRRSDNDGDGNGYDLNFNFRHEFAGNGGELNATARRGAYSGKDDNEFLQTYTLSNAMIENRFNKNTNSGNSLNIKIDYELPISTNSKFGAGLSSYNRRNADTQFSEYMDEDMSKLVDYNISNNFDLASAVHAAYSNFENQITPSFGFQIGLRAEQSTLDTKYMALNPDLSEADRTSKAGLNYLRVYPSVFLTQKMGEEDQIQASYTRRVHRPRGWQVNPFINVSDPMNTRQGNPNLMPEDIHSFELSYGKFWEKATLTSSIYYRRINDVIQSVITTVEGTSGVTFSQFQNISRNEASGLELISQLDFTKNLDMTLNANFFYRNFHGSEEYNIKPTSGFNWNTNVTTNYKIIPNLAAQVRFEYRAPMVQAQGKSTEAYIVDTGLKWDVLDRKGTVSMNVRDLFNQRKWGGYTLTSDFYREQEHRWSRRMFMLSLSYRIGGSNNMRDSKRGRDEWQQNDNGGEMEGGGEFQ